MNQYVLFNFAVQKNDRLYQFQCLPGSPWEELEEVIQEFKDHVAKLKAEAIKAEAEKKAAEESPVVEAEVVS